MGKLYDANWDELSQSTFTGATYLEEQTQEKKYKVLKPVFEDVPIDNTTKKRHVLKFREGQIINQTAVDNAYLEATVTAVEPAGGATAGGTAMTITGTNLTEATGVTVGGAAATNFKVVDDTTITCTSPAGTAGAKDVVVQLYAGNVTKAGEWTYA